MFAPIEQYCEITASIKNIRLMGDLVMQIFDRSGHIVYAEQLSKQEVWGLVGSPPGVPNMLQAERDKRNWATADMSPFTVRFLVAKPSFHNLTPDYDGELNLINTLKHTFHIHVARNSVKKLGERHLLSAAQTSVRIHSIDIAFAQWADIYRFCSNNQDNPDNPPDPGNVADKPKAIRWLSYKLNEIGFWAGPVPDIRPGLPDNDNPEGDFGKAVRRYRTMRRIPLDDTIVPEQTTYPHRAGLQQTRLTDYVKPTSIGKLCTFANHDVMPTTKEDKETLKHLATDNQIKQLMSYLVMERSGTMRSGDNLNDNNAEIKLFIDCNRYYFDTSRDESPEPNRAFSAKQAAESEWLSRPHVPVVATFKIADKQGAAHANPIPEAVGRTTVKWRLRDELLLDNLPGPALPANDPGRSNAYLGMVKTKLKTQAQANDNQRFFFNAPVEVGGCVRPDRDDTVADFFAGISAALAPTPVPSESDKKPGSMKTECVTQSPFRGCSPLYIRPSTIGGDNYHVTAELYFDKTPEGQLNSKLHLELQNRISSKESAKIVVWRRLKVAAIIQWPPRALPIDNGVWQGVQEEMARCYVELNGLADLERLIVNQPPPLPLPPQPNYTISPSLNWLKEAYRLEMQAMVTANRGVAIVPNIGNDATKLELAKCLSVLTSLHNNLLRHWGSPAKGLVASVEKGLQNWAAGRPFDSQPAPLAPPPPAVAPYPIAGARIHYQAIFDAIIQVGGIAPNNSYEWKPDVMRTDLGADASHFDRAGRPVSFSYGKQLNADILREIAKCDSAFGNLYNSLQRYWPDQQEAARMDKGLQNWEDGHTFDNQPAPPVMLPAAVDRDAIRRAKDYYRAIFDAIIDVIWGNVGNIYEWRPTATKAHLSADANHFDQNGKYLPYPYVSLQIEFTDKLLPFAIASNSYTKEQVQESLGSLSNPLPFSVGKLFENGYRRSLLEVQGNHFVRPSDGIILIDHLTVPAVALHTQGAPFSYKDIGYSIGSPMGIAFISQETPMKLYALIAHEMSHLVFFQHHLNAGISKARREHDQFDTNCIMSYPNIEFEASHSMNDVNSDPNNKATLVALARADMRLDVLKEHTLPHIFAPHFCGKCNLHHRGWNVTSAFLPPSSFNNSEYPTLGLPVDYEHYGSP
jgi:hypothetical protein